MHHDFLGGWPLLNSHKGCSLREYTSSYGSDDAHGHFRASEMVTSSPGICHLTMQQPNFCLLMLIRMQRSAALSFALLGCFCSVALLRCAAQLHCSAAVLGCATQGHCSVPLLICTAQHAAQLYRTGSCSAAASCNGPLALI